MRYGTLVLVGLVLAGCGRGTGEHRTYMLQYVPAEAALNALQRPELGLDADVSVTMKPNSSVISLSGERAQLDRALELLREIDRPQPVVRFRFQLVEADGFTATDSAIADVEAALRDLFRFRGYRLAAQAVAQGEAPGHIRQLIGTYQDLPVFVNVDIRRAVRGEGSATVSLDVDLSYGATSILATSLTVAAGKTAVIGSAQTGAGDNTLILVVRPEIE